MQRTTLVIITLILLVGLMLRQQHHLVVAKAAPLYSTLTVTNTADSGIGSLRQAIVDANSTLGTDTITFDAAVFSTPQTITLTSGELVISDSVTITGPGASVLTISGNSSSRVLSIGSGNYDVTLFGLTVINGRHTAPGGGGGILNFSSGTLTLANSALSGNSVCGLGALHGSGGGIFNAGNGALALINSAVSDNSVYGLAGVDIAFGEGGGIFNAGNGTVTLTNSVLSGNSANGGGVAPGLGLGFGIGEGGGIFNAGSGTVTLTNATLSSNSARSFGLPGSGGGIFNASTGAVTLINTTLSDNATSGTQGLGGGIANADGTLALINSTLSGNSANAGVLLGKGGGVYNSGNGIVKLTNSTLTGNSVYGLIQSEGGGIFSEGAVAVNVHNSIIADNSSTFSAPDARGAFNSQGHNLIGNGTGSSGFTSAGDQVGTSGSPINALLAPLANNGGPTLTHALLPGSAAINTGDNCVIQNPGCLATPLSTDQRGAGFPRNSGGTVDIGAFEVQVPSRTVRVVGRTLQTGSSSPVVIEIDAIANENGLAFSLTFDQTRLDFVSASLGSPVASASLNVNSSQITSGRIGVAFALPANQSMPSGTQQVVSLALIPRQNAPPGPSSITFGDSPVLRELVDTTALALPANYQNGIITIEPSYEGDTAPRPYGNGSLSLADWVQTGRFAVGLDNASTGSEFQRADCAPRDTCGNGVLSLADWVQAGRYAAHLDPITSSAGPTSSTSGLAPVGLNAASSNSSRSRRRSIVVVTSPLSRSADTSVVVWVAADGVENAISFSVSFDPSKWEFVGTRVNSDAAGATLIESSSQIKGGRIGFALALPPGRALEPGWRPILDIRFRPLEHPKRAPEIETSSNEPVRRELVDVWGNPIPFDWLSYRQAE